MPVSVKSYLRVEVHLVCNDFVLVLYIFIIITNLLCLVILSMNRQSCIPTFHYYWRIKSSFKLAWIESTSPCNSLIGYLLKWRCCSLVWPHSLLSKTGFDHLGRDQSSLRLWALHTPFVFLQKNNLWNKRVISLLLCTYVSLWVCLCTVLLYISVCISQFESGSGDKIWGIQSWQIICQIKIHTDKSCRLTRYVCVDIT